MNSAGARATVGLVATHRHGSLDLDPARVDLWCAASEEIRDERLLHEYRGLLSEDERRKCDRFYFAADRHRYLVTRALVRLTLSRYVPIPAERWEFAENAYGRPHIGNGNDRTADISFNISHTQGLIVLAIAYDRVVGVDVESRRFRAESLRLAEGFFAEEEVAALRGLPEHVRHERFLHYWTLKESYIKARGHGLSIPLNQFSFHFPAEDRVAIRFHPPTVDDPSRWLFWHLLLGSEHLAALCLERAVGVVPHLIWRKVVPLDFEEIFEPVCLRRSE